MGYISPEIGMALARQMRQARVRVDEARERAQTRYEGREPDHGPVEALQCPRCLALYEFGYDCPDCQVSLLPQGCEVEVQADHRWRDLGLAALSVALLLGGVLLVAMIATL